jgi:hypothetical protein
MTITFAQGLEKIVIYEKLSTENFLLPKIPKGNMKAERF